MTASLGYQQPDQMETTLSAILGGIITDKPLPPGSGILHHAEGVDLLPANIELAGMEVANSAAVTVSDRKTGQSKNRPVYPACETLY